MQDKYHFTYRNYQWYKYLVIISIILLLYNLHRYYIIEAITGETINAFILTLMFTCMDFWTVKNVVGRLLNQLTIKLISSTYKIEN